MSEVEYCSRRQVCVGGEGGSVIRYDKISSLFLLVNLNESIAVYPCRGALALNFYFLEMPAT